MGKKIDIDPSEIERLYWEEEMSMREISDEFGCSHSPIQRIMEDNNIPRQTAKHARGYTYIDPDTLRKMYRDKGMSMKEIGEEFNCSCNVVSRRLKENNIPLRETSFGDNHVLNNCDELHEMYHDKNMSLREIGDELDCSAKTVYRHMKKHGVERDTAYTDYKYVPLDVGQHGYLKWYTHDGDKVRYVSVHRLVAVAEYGFDAVCDMDVHHKNTHKLDNRPENIELMSRSDHARKHGLENADQQRELAKDLHDRGVW